MQVVHDRCCGLDVHKQSVVACLMRTVTAGMRTTETRTFATTTDALTELAGWLSAQGCTHAVLESTGSYWKNHEGCALADAG
jgi:transposase